MNVYDPLGARFVGKRGHRPDIDDIEPRVRRGFDKDAFGRALQRIFPLVQVGAVDDRRLDPVFRQNLGQDVKAGPEQRPAADDVIARFHHRCHGCKDRGHPGCCRLAHGGAFDQRHALLEHVDRRIRKPRINEPVDAVLEGVLRLFGIFVDIAGRREDRLAGFAEFTAFGSTADCKGLRTPAFLNRFVDCHFLLPGHCPNKNPRPKGRGFRNLRPFSDFFNVAASRSAQITTSRLLNTTRAAGRQAPH